MSWREFLNDRFRERFSDGKPASGYRIGPFIHISPWWVWKVLAKQGNYVGVFRNLPGVIKWVPGKLLPRRWGIRILGFEFGERG